MLTITLVPWKIGIPLLLLVLVVEGLTGRVPGVPVDLTDTFGSPVWIVVLFAAAFVGIVLIRIAIFRRRSD